MKTSSRCPQGGHLFYVYLGLSKGTYPKEVVFMYGHSIVLGWLPFFILLLVTSASAQGFNVPSFTGEQDSESPVKLSFAKAGSNVRLRLRLTQGYGLSKDKEYSKVRFFAISQGKKKMIGQKGFSGRTASADKKYYSSVSDILIPRRHFAGAEKAVAHVQLLYCSFAKGVCYRKQEKLVINNP